MNTIETGSTKPLEVTAGLHRHIQNYNRGTESKDDTSNCNTTSDDVTRYCDPVHYDINPGYRGGNDGDLH